MGWGHIQPAAVSLLRGWRPPTSGAKDALWSTRAHIYFTALLGGEWFCSSAPLPMCDIGGGGTYMFVCSRFGVEPAPECRYDYFDK